MKHQSLERVCNWIVRGLLWVIPVLPLYVSSSMLFPFITGRNFAFRIIVEILFVFWLGLVTLSEKYRPRLTPLMRAVVIFLFVVALADLLGVNPYRSFWSNYERMEGLIGILHMAAFFFVTSSVFKKLSDWRLYLYGSSVVSLIVAFMGLSQRLGLMRSFQGGVRVDATIGNPAYLAGYLMFHVFFLLFFLWRERSVWVRWLGILVILFDLYIAYLTATRGVLLGLVVVGGLVAIILAIRRPEGRGLFLIRRVALGVLIVGAVLVLGFFVFKNSDYVHRSPVLSRFANISFTERTVQSRFEIWHIAWQGVKERPILGWGQENFYAVFGKYYDPHLWSSEPWFDRSHNMIFDWLIHAGIVGLLAYLAILGAAARNIWISFRKRTLDFYESLLLGGLLVAYMFQNMFVFDNFQSYLLLFLFLGLTDYCAYGEGQSSQGTAPHGRASRASGVFVVAAVVMAFVVYTANIQPIWASQEIIRGLYSGGTNDIQGLTTHLEQAVGYDTFGTGEAVEQGASLTRNFAANAGDEKVRHYYEFILAQLQVLASGSHPDAKHYLFLGAVYRIAMLASPGLANNAVESYQKALELSPKKQATLFDFSNLYLVLGDTARARSLLQEAVNADPTFPNAHMNLAVAAVLDNKIDLAKEETETYFKLRPEPSYGEIDLLVQAYARAKDYGSIKGLLLHVIEYMERHHTEDSKNTEVIEQLSTVYGKYAAVLFQLGDRGGAKAAALRAAELNPNFKQDADAFIKAIDGQK